MSYDSSLRNTAKSLNASAEEVNATASVFATVSRFLVEKIFGEMASSRRSRGRIQLRILAGVLYILILHSYTKEKLTI